MFVVHLLQLIGFLMFLPSEVTLLCLVRDCGDCVCGAFQPQNADAEWNERFSIECKVSVENASLENVFFTTGRSNLPQDWTLINRTSSSVRLTIPNITNELMDYLFGDGFTSGTLLCVLNTTETQQTEIARTHMLVGAKPYQAVNISADIVEWKRLIIRWWLSGCHLSFPNTYYTVQYKYRNSTNWNQLNRGFKDTCCKGSQPCRVEMPWPQYESHVLQIRIVGHNNLGISQSDIEFRTDEHVAGGDIEPAEVKNTTSSSAVISWTYALCHRPGIQLRINLLNNRTGERTVTVVNCSSGASQVVTLHNLHPYTTYTALLYILAPRPSLDPVTLTFSTLPDVPSVSPRVCAGCFTVRADGGSDRLVTVYWRPVSARQANGPVVKYRVSVISDDKTEFFVDGITYHASFTTPAAVLTKVTVVAQTPDGVNNSLTPEVITIPAVLPPMAARALVLVHHNTSAVQVHWATDSQSLGSYIVWCTQEGNNECTGAIEWKFFPSSVNQSNLQFTDSHTQYMFGISAVTASGATGINWSNCQYTRDVPVAIAKVTSRLKKKLVLQLSANQKACYYAEDIVTYFNITWCPKNKDCLGQSTIVNTSFLSTDVPIEYELAGLLADTGYQLTILTCTMSQRCSTSPLTMEERTLGMFEHWKVVTVVFVVVLILAMLLPCLRSLWYKRCLKTIPITYPNQLEQDKEYLASLHAISPRQSVPTEVVDREVADREVVDSGEKSAGLGVVESDQWHDRSQENVLPSATSAITYSAESSGAIDIIMHPEMDRRDNNNLHLGSSVQGSIQYIKTGKPEMAAVQLDGFEPIGSGCNSRDTDSHGTYRPTVLMTGS